MRAGVSNDVVNELQGDNDNAIVIGNDDIARENQSTSTGNRTIYGEGKDAGLNVIVGCEATNPHAQASFQCWLRVTNHSIDNDAFSSLSLEIGQHHLTEDPALHVFPGIHHHHISIGCQLVTRELVGGSWNE